MQDFQYGVEMDMSVNDIIPNPDQPRKHFDPDELAALGEGLQVLEQLDAIKVFPLPWNDGQRQMFMIFDGERRWRAVSNSGRKQIKVIIVKAPPAKDLYLMAFVKNVGQARHTDKEIYDSLCRVRKDNPDWSPHRLAAACSKPVAWVKKYLRLDLLDRRVLAMMDPATQTKPLSYNQVFPMLNGRGMDADLQFQFAQVVQKNGMSGTEVARNVRQITAAASSASRPARPAASAQNQSANRLNDFMMCVKRVHSVAEKLADHSANDLKALFVNQPPTAIKTTLEALAVTIVNLQSLHEVLSRTVSSEGGR